MHAQARCARCGGAITTGSPHFAEIWGALQELDAVLAAWAGDHEPLRVLLPERPRFLTDLDPPAPEAGDDAATRALLTAVARGDYAGALALLPVTRSPTPPPTPPVTPPSTLPPTPRRAWAAAAIAHERRADRVAALAAWDRVLAAGEDERARLARGSLHAHAGAWELAEADLARAGDGFEARWDRAAVRVHRGVEATPGLPDVQLIEDAQAEVGEVTAYWSDPTIARLLWSLLVERALARQAPDRSTCPDTRALRAAESYFEFDSFWDRAMMLAGWARLGVTSEAARHARVLTTGQLAALAATPPLRGAALSPVAAALASARVHAVADAPAAARMALAPALARQDLRRYRLPCAACGAGTLGIDEVDAGEEDDALAE